MKNTITIITLFISICILSQNTYVPDDNFEQALIDLGYDSGALDNYVLTANINTITDLIIDNKNISSLIGIEDFTALTTLYCYDNPLNNLDVSNNVNLINLFCYGNQLTSLDISQLTSLSQLRCHNNSLTTLDVSNNSMLNRLVCSDNQLTTIDISMHPNFLILNCSGNNISNLDLSQNTNLIQLSCSGNQLMTLNLNQNTNISYLYCSDNLLSTLNLNANPALTTIRCQNNQLTSLYIQNGNNININDFNASNNPNLMCVFVDDMVWSTANWTFIDNTATFVENQSSCDALSIDETISEGHILVYPNPTKESFKIETTLKINEIEIFNNLGKLVLKFKPQENYLISKLPNGIYFIKINANNKTFINKIIIQS